jgi:hypothetical protein
VPRKQENTQQDKCQRGPEPDWGLSDLRPEDMSPEAEERPLLEDVTKQRSEDRDSKP